MANLIYNSRTNTFSPPPPLAPRQYLYVAPPKQLRNVYFAGIPTRPAPAPAPAYHAYNGPKTIWTPAKQFATIPNRPYIAQPQFFQAPKYIQEQAKWGRYAVTDTMPVPQYLPKPNTAKFSSFKADYVKNGQKKILAFMHGRGGTIPSGSQIYMSMIRHAASDLSSKRLKATDLALNKTKGSNSHYLSFGSHLGRTVGSSSPYGV